MSVPDLLNGLHHCIGKTEMLVGICWGKWELYYWIRQICTCTCRRLVYMYMYYFSPLRGLALHEGLGEGVGVLPTQHVHAVPQQSREESTWAIGQVRGQGIHRVHLEGGNIRNTIIMALSLYVAGYIFTNFANLEPFVKFFPQKHFWDIIYQN